MIPLCGTHFGFAQRPKNINNMNKIIRYNLFLTAALLLFVGCLKDSFDDCPRPLRITVRAFDADQRDITTQGDVERVILFVFDHNEQFFDAFDLGIDHITSRRSIEIAFEYGNVPEFLIFDAWANICDLVSFTYPNDVNQRNNVSLQLNRTETLQALTTRRAERETVKSPGDLFFGSLDEVRIDFGDASVGIRDHVVNIHRKTAQVHIITRGLPASNNRTDDHRYEVHGGVDALHHTGEFSGNLVKKVPDTYFNAMGHLVTSTAFRMLASENNSPAHQGENIVVDIFSGDALIHTADSDSDGNPFVAQLGRTLNIIIDISPDDDAFLDVRTVVTPWDVVWQEVDVGRPPTGGGTDPGDGNGNENGTDPGNLID